MIHFNGKILIYNLGQSEFYQEKTLQILFWILNPSRNTRSMSNKPLIYLFDQNEI